MDRWGWVALRAYGPASLVLLAAMVGMAILWSWHTSRLLAGVVVVARWVPLVALVVASGLVIDATFRLVQWQRGAHPSCPKCGGPLGGSTPKSRTVVKDLKTSGLAWRSFAASLDCGTAQCIRTHQPLRHRVSSSSCGRHAPA